MSDNDKRVVRGQGSGVRDGSSPDSSNRNSPPDEPRTPNPESQLNDHLLDSLRAQHSRQNRLYEESLDQFAFNFAHQMKNPLGIIQAAAESLHQKPWITPADHRSREAILRSAQQALSRLQEIEDFSRAVILNSKSQDIGALIEETALIVTERCQQSKIEFITPLLPSPISVNIDRDRLKIAILNILLNGIEALPQGGRLSMTAESSSLRNCIDIKVSDSGLGIRPEHRHLVGQPFFTTKEGHLGIGIALSRRIIQAHQGELMIESIVGRGTRVIITVPMEQIRG